MEDSSTYRSMEMEAYDSLNAEMWNDYFEEKQYRYEERDQCDYWDAKYEQTQTAQSRDAN